MVQKFIDLKRSSRFRLPNGIQIDELIAAMAELLPHGPPYFPEDTLTDATQRFIAAELIREQVFRLTGEEIPYATAVTVESFKETDAGQLVNIEATIHLERDSQKGIVIGRNGSKLKQIGTRSREQIEHMLGCKVYLKLYREGPEKLAQRHPSHPAFRLLSLHFVCDISIRTRNAAMRMTSYDAFKPVLRRLYCRVSIPAHALTTILYATDRRRIRSSCRRCQLPDDTV